MYLTQTLKPGYGPGATTNLPASECFQDVVLTT